MDWQNVYGWYLNRAPSGATPEGSILVGRQELNCGKYLLYIVGPNKKVILEDDTKLSRIIDSVNYNKEDIRLSNIWIYLPDIANDRLSIRCVIDTVAPKGEPNNSAEYKQLKSFGVF